MQTLPRSINPTMVSASRVALGVLFLAVVAGQVIVVITAQSMAVTYPEFSNLQAPLVSAAIACGICIQAVLVILSILVGYSRDNPFFNRSSLRLIRIMAGIIAIATAIVMGTLFLIPGPPALGLLLIGCAITGVTLSLFLFSLRTRLGGTASTRTELAGVN